MLISKGKVWVERSTKCDRTKRYIRVKDVNHTEETIDAVAWRSNGTKVTENKKTKISFRYLARRFQRVEDLKATPKKATKAKVKPSKAKPKKAASKSTKKKASEFNFQPAWVG